MRLFVAVPLPPEVASAGARAVPVSRALRPVRPELMHITLAFLGAVPDGRLADVVAAVGGAGEDHRAFRASVDRLGHFPERGGPPRIIWLGIGEGIDALAALASSVRAALTRGTLPFDEKPFQPHITLARVRDGADRDDVRAVTASLAQLRFAPMRFAVNGFLLLQSDLTPKGPRYTPRAAVPLEVGKDDPERA